MEKPTDSNFEKDYYTALATMKKILHDYTDLLSEEIVDGEGKMQIQEYSDLKRKYIDSVVQYYLKAVKAGGDMKIFKPADQVFYQFRDCFQNLDLPSYNTELIKRDMNEILRRVGTEHILDFPETPKAYNTKILEFDSSKRKRRNNIPKT